MAGRREGKSAPVRPEIANEEEEPTFDPKVKKPTNMETQALKTKNNSASKVHCLSQWKDVPGKIFTGHFQFLNHYCDGKISRAHLNLALPRDGDISYTGCTKAKNAG